MSPLSLENWLVLNVKCHLIISGFYDIFCSKSWILNPNCAFYGPYSCLGPINNYCWKGPYPVCYLCGFWCNFSRHSSLVCFLSWIMCFSNICLPFIMKLLQIINCVCYLDSDKVSLINPNKLVILWLFKKYYLQYCRILLMVYQ